MTRCYDADRRAADEAYLEQLELMMTAMQAAYLAAVAETVDSYRFDDGAGSQQVKQRDTSKMLLDMENLKTTIDWYKRKLGCGLNVNIRQRRRLYQGRVR
jgi:transcription initiation factor IIF auxiliary subunit